jgi:hypothetical protein
MKMFYEFAARNGQENDPQKVASTDEIKQAFETQQKFLVWIALIITGDPEQATQSLVDASALASNPSRVFHDWLVHWARAATLKAALQFANQKIVTEAIPAVPCHHAMHPCLAVDQVQSLQSASATGRILQLDSLARASLIMRGVQNLALQECALLVGTTRAKIQIAYCRALQYCEANELIRSGYIGSVHSFV